MLQPRDRLIVALDVPSAAQARQIVQTIGEAATTYKIGKQLFTAEGPQVVRDLVSSGRKVFLDLKFHDIPNTVAAAVKAAAELGVSMLTVHASGGSKMLKAAVEAASQSPAKPLVLAVTVLTSLSDSDLQELGISGNVLSQVLRLGALARAAGCGGLVASAQEARELRRELGEGFADRHSGNSSRRIRRWRSGTRRHSQGCHRRRSHVSRCRPSHPRSPKPSSSSRGDRARDSILRREFLSSRCTRVVIPTEDFTSRTLSSRAERSGVEGSAFSTRPFSRGKQRKPPDN